MSIGKSIWHAFFPPKKCLTLRIGLPERSSLKPAVKLGVWKCLIPTTKFCWQNKNLYPHDNFFLALSGYIITAIGALYPNLWGWESYGYLLFSTLACTPKLFFMVVTSHDTSVVFSFYPFSAWVGFLSIISHWYTITLWQYSTIYSTISPLWFPYLYCIFMSITFHYIHIDIYKYI